MRKLAALFLAVGALALMGTGVVAADDDSKKRRQTPNTVLECEGIFGPMVVKTAAVRDGIDTSRCGECGTCIASLEAQRCVVLDLRGPVYEEGERRTSVVFVMSCPKPASRTAPPVR